MKEMVNEMRERLSNVINIIKVVSSENEKLKADNALLSKINERLATIINKDAELKLSLKDIIVTFRNSTKKPDDVTRALLELEHEIMGSASNPKQEVEKPKLVVDTLTIREPILNVDSKKVMIEPYGFTLYDILEEIKENLK